MSSAERTGWRDESMSRRHRLFGRDCPATDIDFMMTEYTNKVPVALVEYKNENAGAVLETDANLQCLTNLANMAGLPIFGVRYASDFSWYFVAPLNDKAEVFQPEPATMAELEYVDLLYRLRGTESVPEAVKESLATAV